MNFVLFKKHVNVWKKHVNVCCSVSNFKNPEDRTLEADIVQRVKQWEVYKIIFVSSILKKKKKSNWSLVILFISFLFILPFGMLSPNIQCPFSALMTCMTSILRCYSITYLQLSWKYFSNPSVWLRRALLLS